MDLMRIPADDMAFDEEPEDELASAGFRVVDGDKDEELEELEPVDAAEAVAEAAEDLEKQDEEDAKEEVPADGLVELEELEKNLEETPLTFDEYED